MGIIKPNIKASALIPRRNVNISFTWKECEYFIYLEALEAQGAISELQRQTRFELQPSFKHNGKTIRSITYVADFTFKDKDGGFHIVDTKGVKTEVYKLKKKMMQYQGYDIEEV